MQVRSFLMGALSSVLLTGCTSLNVQSVTIQYSPVQVSVETEMANPPRPAAEPASALVAPAAVAPASTPSPAGPGVLLCPVFVPPPTRSMPLLPYKELEAAGNDAAKIEEVKRKHIEDLRAFIARGREEQSAAYQRYLQSCKHKK